MVGVLFNYELIAAALVKTVNLATSISVLPALRICFWFSKDCSGCVYQSFYVLVLQDAGCLK